MKVLWFEISTPSQYNKGKNVTAGWQDSLELVVREQCKNIDLYIAFISRNPDDEVREINGVTYIPMYVKYSLKERRLSNWSWRVEEQKTVSMARMVLQRYHPDVIHVFGNEWPFGLIQQYTEIPVVIHIQGSIIPYNNAMYPPKYNGFTLFKAHWYNLRKCYHQMRGYLKDLSREDMEKRTWYNVSRYMGRTVWDKSLVNTIRDRAEYFHVDEALRPSFLHADKLWHSPTDSKIRLITVGCSSFWKGIDMLLKTAKILTEKNIDFEWLVAGKMSDEQREIVEKTEGTTFKENHVEVLGFVQPEQLIDLLTSSTMYVHTAYIENSPNSICEAQYLGVPIVSTHVGGIASLVEDGKEGDLVPANDPWQMAYAILKLSEDKERMLQYSTVNIARAHFRHSPENIARQLMSCYKSVVNNQQ